jgi:hypothetical protein
MKPGPAFLAYNDHFFFPQAIRPNPCKPVTTNTSIKFKITNPKRYPNYNIEISKKGKNR